MPVNQLWRQLKVRLLSTWYYTKPGVNVLTRKTGRFWTGIACHCNSFNCLKDTKKLQKSWVLPPETPPGLFIRLWSVEGGEGGGSAYKFWWGNRDGRSRSKVFSLWQAFVVMDCKFLKIFAPQEEYFPLTKGSWIINT